VPGGLGVYGMGYVRTSKGAEVLYGAEVAAPFHLFAFDTTTYTGTIIGTITPLIGGVALTGDDSGRLFAFDGSTIYEIDTTTARVLHRHPIGTTTHGSSAFVGWGSDFYLFIDYSVERFRPADGSVTTLSVSSTQLLSAGTGPCR
jgi:hypothetical protein